MDFALSVFFRAVDRVTGPVSRMQRSIQRLQNAGIASFKKMSTAAASFASQILRTGTLITAGALSFTLVDAAQKYISVEQNLVNAGAKFSKMALKGSEDFERMALAAKKIGAETEFSTTQAAEGFNFLAMAGFNVDQAIAALPGIVDLATAAQMDLATATDIASDALGSFNMMTDDATKLSGNLTKINDVLARTVTTSNTTISMMFETIKKAAPVGVTAGVSLETFAALTGKLARGMKGEVAGTTLKNIFLSLAAQTPKAANALKLLGVTTQDQKGNLRDVIDIFEDINKGIQREKLGTAETAAVLDDIFGKIPIAGVNILLQTGSKELRRYREQIEKSTGAGKDMATVIRDTLGNSIKALLSAFEALQITIFELQSKNFEDFIEKLTGITRNINEFIKSNKELASSIVLDIIRTLIAAGKILLTIIGIFLVWKITIFAINLMLVAFTGIMIFVKGIMLVFQAVMFLVTAAQIAWNIAMSLSPLGVFLALVIIFVAAAALIMEYWDPISDFFMNLWTQISNIFSTSIEFILNLFKPISDLIEGITKISGKFSVLFSEEKQPAPTPASGSARGGSPAALVSKNEVMTQLIKEKKEEKSSAELVIRDETGRAQLNEKSPANAVKLSLIKSGE